MLEKENDNIKLRCVLEVGHEPFLYISFCNVAVTCYLGH